MASGRGEMVDRLAEAVGQLVTNVVNLDLTAEQQLALAGALEQGGRLELATRLNPFELAINVVTLTGGSVNVARYLDPGTDEGSQQG